jgi:hypothetical protein
VTIFGDFKQRCVYCHKDNEFDSLRRKDDKLEESKQRIEQARVELRALDIEQELRARSIDEVKQTHKAFSFRKAILRQDRQDDQQRFAQAQEQLVEDRESSQMIAYKAPRILSDMDLRDHVIELNSSCLSFKNDLSQNTEVCEIAEWSYINSKKR